MLSVFIISGARGFRPPLFSHACFVRSENTLGKPFPPTHKIQELGSEAHRFSESAALGRSSDDNGVMGIGFVVRWGGGVEGATKSELVKNEGCGN
jgi:hypothetical protein